MQLSRSSLSAYLDFLVPQAGPLSPEHDAPEPAIHRLPAKLASVSSAMSSQEAATQAAVAASTVNVSGVLLGAAACKSRRQQVEIAEKPWPQMG